MTTNHNTLIHISSPLKLKRITLANRIVRAATYENAADERGRPTAFLGDLYSGLAQGGCRTIITGFNYTSLEGRAMHPFQAGIDDEEKVAAWQKITASVKTAYPDVKMIMQISHAGRQTMRRATHMPLKGAGPVKCTYFRQKVEELTTDEAWSKINEYVRATKRVQQAGFDAVQIHAAHGYLIHQFLSPFTNRRRDLFGEDRTLFLKHIVEGVKSETRLPIFLKISASDDRQRGLNLPLIMSYWPIIDNLKVDAVEISYGMMETAFNIIRGEHPLEPVLKHNPLFNRYHPFVKWLFRHLIFHWYKRSFIKYSDMYNLENAAEIKAVSETPILVTGGVRTRSQIERIINIHGLDGVTLSRPLICEPDFVNRLMNEDSARSKCTACNLCTVMSDSRTPLRCYGKALK